MSGLSNMPGVTGCRLARATMLSLVLWLAVPPSARAEATITGTRDRVRIEVSNGTVEELLLGLCDKFGLAYRSGKPLDAKVEGTYAGSLAGVVKRLLVNYDYVLSLKSDGGKDALVVAVYDKGDAALQRGASGVPRRDIGEGQQVANPKNPAPVRSTDPILARIQSQASAPLPAGASQSPAVNRALRALVQGIDRVNR